MKFLLALTMLSGSAFASTLTLEKFDELKLAEFMGRLPRSVKTMNVTKIDAPKSGVKVQSTFPADGSLPFGLSCESTYFNSSSVISFAKCKLNVDFTSASLQKSYDEALVLIKDPALVSAIREAMVEGNLRKEYRAYGKSMGTTLSGKWAWVFTYFFSCSKTECRMVFSPKE